MAVFDATRRSETAMMAVLQSSTNTRKIGFQGSGMRSEWHKLKRVGA